jgi:hypothetical protein
MNVITQTQAFPCCSDDDECVSVSAGGIIPLVSPPIVAKENVVGSAISYYDIFQRPYKFRKQVKCCNTPLHATSVKAHKRKQRSAKKSPPSAVKVNLQMEECDRKAIAALKTQQLFEIKARFARTS